MAGRPLGRRALLAGVLVALTSPAMVLAQPLTEPILVISRERVLEEAIAAAHLNQAEARLTERLQAEVEVVKRSLAAEEQELARLRATLPREEFDRRVTDFDQRVRRERRETQRRAAALQTAFRRARTELAEAMVPILVEISQERGARIVLDRDQILVAHPSVDVTEAVIAAMDAKVPLPELPELDELELEEIDEGDGSFDPTLETPVPE